jgi:hypothetical protein
MRTGLQRPVAALTLALVAGAGMAAVSPWSPTPLGLVAPASADDGGRDDEGRDDDSRDDDGGQVPVGGVDTGWGGSAQADDDGGDDDADDGGAGDDDADDGGANDGGGQVPVGGVDTGRGGAAQSWAGEPASSSRDQSSGLADVAGTVAPFAAVGLGGLAAGRLILVRRDGS